MVEPIHKSATWIRKGTPDEALHSVESYTDRQNGRFERDGNAVTLSFGSKLAYRLWGIWFPRGRAMLPFKVLITAAAENGSETILTAEAVSDEGPMFTRIPSSAIVFEDRMSEALLQLQSQLQSMFAALQAPGSEISS